MIGSKKENYNKFLSAELNKSDFSDLLRQAPYRFLHTADVSRLLFYNSIYEQILPLQGQIHITGVAEGNTLFILAHLSEIMDSLNTSRQIVGFDLFDDHQTTYPFDFS